MILLDTKTLIFWVNREGGLSEAAFAAIEAERPRGAILISAISAWEINLFVQQKRLALRMDPTSWLTQIGNIPEIQFTPMDNDIAMAAVTLPAPAPVNSVERILAATARKFGCAIVTGERKLQNYPHVKVIW